MSLDDIPGVLTMAAPEAPVTPVVFDSPHSGSMYPADFGSVLPLAVLRKAEDSYVDALFADAPHHGAWLLKAQFPRIYIDPNRNLADLDLDLLADPWPGPVAPSEKTARGLGLIWRRSNTNRSIYDRRLSAREVQARIDTYYVPYHAALRRLLDDTHARFGTVYHINCHSMPSFSNDLSPEGPGLERPEFNLGDRDGTTCGANFTRFVAETLTRLGGSVSVNKPYKGVELVRAYSNPRTGRHSLQIEIKRNLYMDEETLEKRPGFDRLQGLMSQLAQAVCAYARERPA